MLKAIPMNRKYQLSLQCLQGTNCLQLSRIQLGFTVGMFYIHEVREEDVILRAKLDLSILLYFFALQST